MIFEFKNYRSFLRAVLAKRVERNPRYSLRAFAQQLGFASSSLSEVINGRANFSTQAARKVGRGLKLTADETEYLTLLVALDSERDPDAREALLKRMRDLNPELFPAHDLSVDQFRQIADWYHSPILEIFNLDGVEFSAEAASALLGITLTEATAAIGRLERLEIIERGPDGKYRRTQDRFVVRSANSNSAMRQFYHQMLMKADQALETQTPAERVSGYETFSFSSAALPEARKALDRYLNELEALSRKYPGRQDIYHALVHLFNLTPRRKQP